MTTEDAIKAVVIYHTLPPQIDFREPWAHKANVAEDYLNTLPTEERIKAFEEIDKQIDAYHTPDESGVCIAYLDSKF